MGYEPFPLCKENSILGIGWSYIFESHTISSLEDSYEALREKEGAVPRPVERFMEELQAGDFVWMHQAGQFYLCRILDNETVLGSAIHKEYRKYDLGHARNAEWVCVPEVLVSGRIQRSTIAQRTIQKIHCSEPEKESFIYIHKQLAQDPQWFPAINDVEIEAILGTTSHDEVLQLLSPDDHEDLVAAYLQARGWTLVKSTCFRSKPQFEFRMVRSGPKFAHVQVKSGSVQLVPAEYLQWVNDKETVFLYSTHEIPYPGNRVSGVNTLDPKEVLCWARNNSWVLPMALKVQLQIIKNLSSR